MSFGRRLSDLLALAASLLAVAYGAYLLVVGRETNFMTPEGAVGTASEPSLAGLIPLGIGLLALWAAVKHRTIGLWAAAGLAAAFALLFLFSLALQFALLAAVLLVAAAVSTAFTRDVHRP
jgi:hypothetical protein